MTATYADQLDLLDAVADSHRNDADVIEAVIRADAATHGGEVNTNRVRAALRRNHPDVRPQVTGAVYSGMARSGVLERIAECPSEDLLSRNRNKNAVIYRLTP